MAQQRNEEARFPISNGPGKFDLMMSLFSRQIVTFKLGTGSEVRVLITSITQEDGSCESWIISGYIVGYNERFRGYYRTRGNNGYFIF